MCENVNVLDVNDCLTVQILRSVVCCPDLVPVCLSRRAFSVGFVITHAMNPRLFSSCD